MTQASDKLAPHPVLERYYDSPETRQDAVDQMFDESAGYYDRVIAAMSFGSGTWYRQDALRRAGVTAGSAVLDVGAGTGAVTLPAQQLSGPSGTVVALDPSTGMLSCGVARGIQRAVRGFGEQIPFPDESFDFVTMGYALRHVSDLTETFREYRRVLKPGGRVLLLEISRPEPGIKHQLMKIYLRHVVPNVSALLSGRAQVRRLMQYYWDTIDQCVAPKEVVGCLADAGFDAPARGLVMGLFSEYTGQRPPTARQQKTPSE